MAKKKVIVVDDSPNVLEVVVSLLQPEGFEVGTCQNIDEAFSLIQKEIPDLLILDVMMPSKEGHDGFSLCSRIKEDPKTSNIPVVFLSGIAAESGQNEEELKQKLSAEDFIHKPFDSKDFVRRIKEKLDE